jgi:serine/threonine protein kinase
MSERDQLNLAEGTIVALPFFENEKFVVGSKRGGGMGNVYQLIPLVAGAPLLALKTYQGTGDYDQFEREARIWVSLGAHPNVARAITYGMLRGVRCILANWYPRTALDLKAQSLSIEEILRFASGVLTGLSDGYEIHRLIHKDIKPSNILIDADNAPRLADFGVSSIVPPNPSHRRPYANTVELKETDRDKNSNVSGTPIYMAPELFHGEKNSIKSDIFALGITLFEWLTGAHPYLSPTGESIYARVPMFSNAMRQRHGEEIGPLIALILLSIRLDANDRPGTYAQLLEQSGFATGYVKEQEDLNRKVRPAAFDVISRAQVLRRQGLVHEAVSLLHSALEKQPHDVLLLTAYATTQIKLNEMSAALPYLDRAVALNRKNKNRYLDQPYVEPNVNLALLLLSAKKFDEAVDILKEATRWLEFDSAGSDLSLTYWEFGWLALFEGHVERAAQLFFHYVSKRTAIGPVISMFSLAAFMLPNRNEYFSKFFDLTAAAGCGDVLSGQYYCVIASHLDSERIYKFNKTLLTPSIVRELEELSVAVSGFRDGFKVPLTDQMMRRLLLSVDDQYCGGKYRGIL